MFDKESAFLQTELDRVSRDEKLAPLDMQRYQLHEPAGQAATDPCMLLVMSAFIH